MSSSKSRSGFFDFSRRQLGVLAIATTLTAVGCEDSGKKSASLAKEHVAFLAAAVDADVKEVRAGLPEGAKLLSAVFRDVKPELPNAQVAFEALTRTRDRVQDLRVSKGTFFALAAPDGRIIRNDQERDDMVDKNLFKSFPDLEKALLSGYGEGRGSMPEAAGVRGREDGQWVSASRVEVDGEALGLYVTGWSWSSYAYRLETSIRSHLLGETPEGGKIPLVYVYLVVGSQVFGAPVSPEVSAKAIATLEPQKKAQAADVFTTPLEIDGRSFGLALKRLPALGEDVLLAVLRSET